MKAFYKMFCLVVMTALVFSLTACAPIDSGTATKDNYEVYLDSSVQSSTGTLAITASAYHYKRDRPLTTPADNTISVMLNGESQTLYYTVSEITLQNNETYDFASEDRNITFRYYSPNMQLDAIILRNQDMSSFENMTQAEYEAWIRQFVAQYTTENWDEYQANYRTEYTFGEGLPYKNNEFMDTLPAGATLKERVFYYVKYYQTLKTVDMISVRFSYNSETAEGKIIVFFNPRWFDTYHADLDIDKMHTAITDYVKANLWENTTLQDIAFSNGTLLRVDGNYLCKWTVATQVLTDKGEVVTDSYDLVVDVPDA